METRASPNAENGNNAEDRRRKVQRNPNRDEIPILEIFDRINCWIYQLSIIDNNNIFQDYIDSLKLFAIFRKKSSKAKAQIKFAIFVTVPPKNTCTVPLGTSRQRDSPCLSPHVQFLTVSVLLNPLRFALSLLFSSCRR